MFTIENFTWLFITLASVILASDYIQSFLVPEFIKRKEYWVTDKSMWERWLLISQIVAIIVSIILYIKSPESESLIFLYGLVTFFLAVMAQSDLLLMLVPKEITTLFIMISVVLGAVMIREEGIALGVPTDMAEWFTSTGLWAGVALILGYGTLLFLVSVFWPVAGFADIKTFWALGLSVGVVATPYGIFIVYMACSLLAVIYGLVLRSKAVPLLPSLFVATVGGVLISS